MEKFDNHIVVEEWKRKFEKNVQHILNAFYIFCEQDYKKNEGNSQVSTDCCIYSGFLKNQQMNFESLYGTTQSKTSGTASKEQLHAFKKELTSKGNVVDLFKIKGWIPAGSFRKLANKWIEIIISLNVEYKYEGLEGIHLFLESYKDGMLAWSLMCFVGQKVSTIEIFIYEKLTENILSRLNQRSSSLGSPLKTRFGGSKLEIEIPEIDKLNPDQIAEIIKILTGSNRVQKNIFEGVNKNKPFASDELTPEEEKLKGKLKKVDMKTFITVMNFLDISGEFERDIQNKLKLSKKAYMKIMGNDEYSDEEEDDSSCETKLRQAVLESENSNTWIKIIGKHIGSRAKEAIEKDPKKQQDTQTTSVTQCQYTTFSEKNNEDPKPEDPKSGPQQKFTA